MAENPKTQGASAGTESIERRAWVRYACDVSGSCQPVTGGGDRSWPARVHNISRGGVKLCVSRRFEPGTLLQIDLTTSNKDEPQSVLARVIHVTPQTLGQWALGCAFHRELSEESVQSLVNQLGPETE
jgi:hypothetical protein